MPLNVIFRSFASTGARPVRTIRLLLVVKLVLLFTEKLHTYTVFRRLRMAVRWPEMKVFASPKGERGVTPLARNARYFASITGSTLLATIGPLASSLRPRR